IRKKLRDHALPCGSTPARPAVRWSPPSTCCRRSKKASSKIGTGLLPAVELRGFEPLTPSMRTRCATGLRYSPLDLSYSTKLCGLLAPPAAGARARRVADGAEPRLFVPVVVVLVGGFRVRVGGGVLAGQAGREVPAGAGVRVVGADRGRGAPRRERRRCRRDVGRGHAFCGGDAPCPQL